jgi:secondary thiamine-phosphate synthase enzyme
MRQTHATLTVATRGQGLTDVSADIVRFVRDSGLRTGLLTVFIRHTSASLTIQENADPAVLADLNAFFRRLVAEDEHLYRHADEGPDDMPAHIRAALTQTQLSIPVIDGRPVLGTWQGIYLFEHRTHAHQRQLTLHLLGE